MVVADIVKVSPDVLAFGVDWSVTGFPLESNEYKDRLASLALDISGKLENRSQENKRPFTKEEYLAWFPDLDKDRLEILWEKQTKLLDEGVGAVAAVVEFSDLFRSMEIYGRDDLDGYTERHQRRVSELSSVIYALCVKAKLINQDDLGPDLQKMLNDMGMSGAGHDIGKLGLPDAILTNIGLLSPDQRRLINLHPILSQVLLAPFDGSDKFISVVQSHHEKWDGTGYPRGLKGEDIPFEARIAAIADVYDALIARRPYRERADHEKLMEVLRDKDQKLFDPEIIKVILPHLENDDEWLHRLSLGLGGWDEDVLASRLASDPSTWSDQMEISE